jgi:hypothetical protein
MYLYRGRVETHRKGGLLTTHPRRPGQSGRLPRRGHYRAHSKTWREPHNKGGAKPKVMEENEKVAPQKAGKG